MINMDYLNCIISDIFLLTVNNLSTSSLKEDLINTILIEITKLILTAFIGFITFKIYERYKNKSSNIKKLVLYNKLQSEIEENNKLLKFNSVELNIYNSLIEKFNKNNFQLKYFMNILEGFNDYKEERLIQISDDDYDEIVRYREKPHQLIEQLSNYIHYNDDLHEQLKQDKETLEQLKKMDIYKDLFKLKKYLNTNYDLSYDFPMIYSHLSENLNSLSKLNSRDLNDYCVNLLESNLELNNLKLEYKSYKQFLKSNNKIIKLNFEIWNSSNVEILAEDDMRFYLHQEQFYKDNSQRILSDDMKNLNDVINTFENQISQIQLRKSRLEKVLSKNNWLFKDI